MRRFVAAITALTLMVTAAVVFADSALAASPLTFDGQCQFAGTSSFSSAVTLIPSPIHNDVSATGTCSGSLAQPNGATIELSDAPVQYEATEFGSAESCEADLDASGSGALVFQQGSLDFRVVENRVSGQALLAYTGRNGGSAKGIAYVNSADPASLLEQCAAGGMTSAPVSIVFQTTPTISG